VTPETQKPRFPEALADLPCTGVVLQVLALHGYFAHNFLPHAMPDPRGANLVTGDYRNTGIKPIEPVRRVIGSSLLLLSGGGRGGFTS
jgi:hypothetical protein